MITTEDTIIFRAKVFRKEIHGRVLFVEYVLDLPHATKLHAQLMNVHGFTGDEPAIPWELEERCQKSTNRQSLHTDS